MSPSSEITKLAEDLAGRQLASAVIGPTAAAPALLEAGQAQLKVAFLDDATKQVRDWWGRQSEDLKGGLRGAGIGAGLGMAAGAVTSRRHPLRDALIGGLLGGGLGGTAGYAVGLTSQQKTDKDRLAAIAAGKLNPGDNRNLLGFSGDLVDTTVNDKGVTGRSLRGAAAGVGINAGIGALFPGSGTSRWGGVGQSFKSPTRLGLFGGVGGVLGGLNGPLTDDSSGSSAGSGAEQMVLENYAKIAPVLPPDLLQQGKDVIDKMRSNIIDSDTASQLIRRLHGEATQRKGGTYVKRAEGEERGNLVQRYWADASNAGRNALKQVQDYEKAQGIPGVLLGSGIGALAGGAIGLSNRRNRFRGMLAGLLGGGLAGAGIGHLANSYSGQTKGPDSSTEPTTDQSTGGDTLVPPGAQHPSHRRFFVLPGTAAGATAGAALGPKAIRYFGSAPDRAVARAERQLQTLRGVATGPSPMLSPEARLGSELFGLKPPEAGVDADTLKRINSTDQVKKLESQLLDNKLKQTRPANKMMQSPRFSRMTGIPLGGALGGGLGGLLGSMIGEYDYANKYRPEQVK